MKQLKNLILVILLLIGVNTTIKANNPIQGDDHNQEVISGESHGVEGALHDEGENAHGSHEEPTVAQLMFEHVLDAHIWHFTETLTLYLPVIVWSEDTGIKVFSSSRFYSHHQPTQTYEGFSLHSAEGSYLYHIQHESGKYVLDLSITKNVLMLFLVALVLYFIVTSAAKFYKKNPLKAPKGIAAFLEPIIIFLRDEVIKANIGEKHYERFLPYLINLFFFILVGNLMGLLPGAANLTGNIAFTSVLAIGTFLLTNFNGNANYWKHIFWTPGVPTPLKLIIVPVEIFGLFTKPISLLVRLFVAITAGHFVVLTFIMLGLSVLMNSYVVEGASSILAVVINLIEILVAVIQAYVFTMFSSLYIGMAVEEHDHH